LRQRLPDIIAVAALIGATAFPLIWTGLAMHEPPLLPVRASAGSRRGLAQIKQTVWKRLRLSGDKSRKLLSAIVEHSGAGCRRDDAIVVHVGRSGQYRASRHLRAAAIIASTPRMLSARRKL
jgi:hypothetical protein